MSYTVTIYVAGTTTPFETLNARDYEFTTGGLALALEHSDYSGSLWPIDKFVFKFEESEEV